MLDFDLRVTVEAGVVLLAFLTAVAKSKLAEKASDLCHRFKIDKILMRLPMTLELELYGWLVWGVDAQL